MRVFSPRKGRGDGRKPSQISRLAYGRTTQAGCLSRLTAALFGSALH
jgi:hypothetical protein